MEPTFDFVLNELNNLRSGDLMFKRKFEAGIAQLKRIDRPRYDELFKKGARK